jgi:hypothetical protein
VIISKRFRNLLLGGVLVYVLMLAVLHFGATISGAYKLAVTTAHEAPMFTESLGAPVAEAWFSDGKWVWGNPATAEMTIPVRGQMRKGNLRAMAIKDGERWRLTELTLELSQPDHNINLLSDVVPSSGDSRR